MKGGEFDWLSEPLLKDCFVESVT